jgi:hypothetical protein
MRRVTTDGSTPKSPSAESSRATLPKPTFHS